MKEGICHPGGGGGGGVEGSEAEQNQRVTDDNLTKIFTPEFL